MPIMPETFEPPAMSLNIDFSPGASDSAQLLEGFYGIGQVFQDVYGYFGWLFRYFLFCIPDFFVVI